jgi:hypothetical protein
MAGQLGSAPCCCWAYGWSAAPSLFWRHDLCRAGRHVPGDRRPLCLSEGDLWRLHRFYLWLVDDGRHQYRRHRLIAFVCGNYAGYFVHLPRFAPPSNIPSNGISPLADIYPLENFGVKGLSILILLCAHRRQLSQHPLGQWHPIPGHRPEGARIALVIGGILLSGQGHAGKFITNAPGLSCPAFLLSSRCHGGHFRRLLFL